MSVLTEALDRIFYCWRRQWRECGKGFYLTQRRKGQGSAVKQSCWRVPRHKGTAEPFRVLGYAQVEEALRSWGFPK